MGLQSFSNNVMSANIKLRLKKISGDSIKTPYGELKFYSGHTGIFRPHNRSDGYPRVDFNYKTGKVSIRDQDAPSSKWAASILLFNKALDSI